MAKALLIVAALTGVAAVTVGGSMSSDSGKPAERRVAHASAAAEDSPGYERVAEDGTVELQRSDDGHFYADVTINSATVHALVDTGATAIALSREDARNAGLATSLSMPEVIGKGADGDVYGEVVTLDRVALGHKSAQGMGAIVLNSGEQTLLGQSFLAKFDAVEIRGDTMILR